MARHSQPRGNGGGEDEPTFGRDVLERGLGDEELGLCVQGKGFVKVGLGGVAQRDELFHARVGDDDVEVAEVGDRLLEEEEDGREGGDVGLDGERAGAGGGEGGDEGRGGGGG